MPSDSQPDSRWVSFAELADARGISKASAVKLVRRHGWRRQRDNQGRVLALVPETWISGEEDGEADSPTDTSPSHPIAMAAIEAAHRGEVEALKGQVEALKTLADATGARLADAETRLTETTARAEQAEQARDTARGEAQKTREAVRKLEAAGEAARKARGRLRRAWDGWRGR